MLYIRSLDVKFLKLYMKARMMPNVKTFFPYAAVNAPNYSVNFKTFHSK